MAAKRKRKLAVPILWLSIFPIVVLCAVLTYNIQKAVREGMSYEIEHCLSGTAHSVISMYNIQDGGQFSYEDDHLYKGETDVTSDYRILDDIKNDTGVDVTICYGNIRRLTTLTDSSGKRIVGTKVPEDIEEHVLEKGEEYFSQHVDINGKGYFAYYVPIRNDENEVVGASFAGKSASSVNLSMQRAMRGNIFLTILISLVASLICIFFARRIVDTIQHIKRFLGELAKGEFTVEMPDAVLNRGDELAEMGEYAVSVGKSLEELVTLDPLTRLLNRRACLTKAKKRKDNVYTLAMCDIDFFKNVNDTYGHKTGDAVLQYVSDVLRTLPQKQGFVSRWGGEEFLIGFDLEQEKVCERLEEVRQQIQEKEFSTASSGNAGIGSDTTFNITVTFGVTSHPAGEHFDETVKRVDKLLYKGKENGRNQVSSDV